MQTIILIIFLIFSLLIYYINNIFIISSLFLITLFSLIILKIKLKCFKHLLVLTLITVIINLFFLDFNNSILIGLRLFIIYFLTLIICNYMSCQDISNSLSNLFFFTKKKSSIKIIIAISLSLIPILIDEVKNIKNTLISKNFAFSFKNILKRPNIYLNTYLNNIFIRIKELEKTLTSRNY